MIINGKSAVAALVKARAAIGATVAKDARANYGKYATLAAVMEAISPALAANALALVQEAWLDDQGVTVSATLAHESGETIEFAPLTMPLGNQRTPQAVGSAITYGRRYQLTALFGLAPDDDDGAEAQKTAPERANGRATPVPTAPPTKAPQRPAVPATAQPNGVTVDGAPAVSQDGPEGNPFDDAAPVAEPMVDDATQKRLHALGTELYGADWDRVRHENIGRLTHERTHSSKDLTLAEAKRLIAGMVALQAKMQQPDAKRKAVAA